MRRHTIGSQPSKAIFMSRLIPHSPASEQRGPSDSAPPLKPRRILETCLSAEDLAAADRFYSEVLGLERVASEIPRHVFFRCGDQMLLIFNPHRSSIAAGEIPPHGSFGQGHVAFAATDDELAAWKERLERSGTPIETIHDWPQGGRSIYFRDPAGNSLEFATPRIWGLE